LPASSETGFEDWQIASLVIEQTPENDLRCG
jgi:hypothetical protein